MMGIDWCMEKNEDRSRLRVEGVYLKENDSHLILASSSLSNVFCFRSSSISKSVA